MVTGFYFIALKNNSKPISLNLKVANVKNNFRNDEGYFGKHLSVL